MKATPSEVKQCNCYRNFAQAKPAERLPILAELVQQPPYTLLACGHVLATETLLVLKASMRELSGISSKSELKGVYSFSLQRRRCRS